MSVPSPRLTIYTLSALLWWWSLPARPPGARRLRWTSSFSVPSVELISLICSPRPPSIGLAEQFPRLKILNTRSSLPPTRDAYAISSTVIGCRAGFKRAACRGDGARGCCKRTSLEGRAFAHPAEEDLCRLRKVG